MNTKINQSLDMARENYANTFSHLLKIERILAPIVGKLSESPLGKELNLGGDIDTTMAALAAKYDAVMTAVPALRGASQIVKVAVETLKKELPPAPPTVNDIRRDESKAKREAISAGRLDSIKNRGKPSADGGSAVGRL